MDRWAFFSCLLDVKQEASQGGCGHRKQATRGRPKSRRSPGGNDAKIGAAAQRANGAADDPDDLRVSAAVPSMGSKPVAGLAAWARPSRGCLVALRLFSQKEGSPSAMARGLLFPGLAGGIGFFLCTPAPASGAGPRA